MLKDLWNKWKVQVTMVGGALVIMTAYGTCTIDPNEEAVKEVVQEKVLGKEEASEPEETQPIPKEVVDEVEGPAEAIEEKEAEEVSEED